MKATEDRGDSAQNGWRRLMLAERRPRPVLFLLVTIGVLGLDYLAGPEIRFPILYVVPVVLAAWYGSWAWSAAIAVVVSVFRLWFELAAGDPQLSVALEINWAVRACVLLLLAFFVAETSQLTRSLQREVKTLRGLLPICAFCKRIRKEDNSWEQIELYVSRRSEAQFSHGLCPDCRRKHYPDFPVGE